MRAALAVAETYPIVEAPRLHMAEEPPSVIAIPETPEDIFDRDRAARLIRSVGAAALTEEVTIDSASYNREPTSMYPTLMHALHAAATEDRQAFKLVETNVRALIAEIILKSGHVMSVPIEVDEGGKLGQYGQAMEDVFINALRIASPMLRSRTEAETRNGMRIESACRRGLLKTHQLVVFSRYRDGVSDEQAEALGFFADTKSCSIQAITETAQGQLTQESVFVAGVRRKDSDRHDIDTLTELGHMLGIELTGKTDAETIDTPLLVPKEYMPNGVIDLVRMYDKAAGGTFFGEAKPPQDYLQHLKQCREREAELEPTVQRVIMLLLAESESITSPEMAINRLHKLAEAGLVCRSLTDRDIDPAVFGHLAAARIERGRYRLDRGDVRGAEEEITEAIEVANSVSCPGAFERQTANKLSANGESGAAALIGKRRNASEACVISTTGCYCCGLNRDGTSRPVRLTVKAYIDSNETIHCLREGCGAWLAKGGKSKFTGHIAKRAEKLKSQRGLKISQAETALPSTGGGQDAQVLQFPARKRAPAATSTSLKAAA